MKKIRVLLALTLCLLLVPALGYFGAALGNPMAWILADIFLIPAYLLCRRALISGRPGIRQA